MLFLSDTDEPAIELVRIDEPLMRSRLQRAIDKRDVARDAVIIAVSRNDRREVLIRLARKAARAEERVAELGGYDD